jgi:hypothetical protein
MLGIAKEVATIAQQPTAAHVKGLKRIIPSSTITSMLKKVGQARRCCRAPKQWLVWVVIGMGLFGGDCIRQVARWLQPFRSKTIPKRSTLCEGRQRLGVGVFFWLYRQVVRLLALRKTPGTFYRHLRLMAVDGFVTDIPDTPENERVFGRPKNGRCPGAFPQTRLVALCEIGTHVIWKFVIKPIRRAEIVMVRALLRWLDRDMLLLWDRGFLSYDNVWQVCDRKAQLLARIKKNLKFEATKILPDGSYLAKMYKSSTDRKNDRNGLEVRIIEYTLTDPNRSGQGEVHRLLTTLLDPQVDPAERLVELYHERWEIELTIDEIKTHQKGRPVLRSETPAGVVQELYGLLLAHFVVRTLMVEAAAKAGVAPRRISFTAALTILRCRLAECPRTERGRERWLRNLLEEIAEEVLEERRDRINPRVIKKKISKWAKKRPHHRRNPQPTMKFRESIKIKC